ncbi:MAG: Serine/threonine-protein kinase [Candelina mexicana]|nr:MAG: Serine/threonine-protein kinase [Candelina mexicana]
MGQGYSLTTLSAGSAGIDVPELSDLTYEKSLGTARFMKSIRARHRNGLVFVKVVMKPYSSMKLDQYVRAIRRERKALADVPNALGYQRILETSTNGYLVRQYLYNSLYDRMSTRPFLEDIEKKWLAFQLLCALRDCHSRDVYHGDIKTENTLVTSWNWLFISDFSASFKPTYLPEDNPADFSYYFDTSSRRTCYLAPERFLASGEKSPGDGKVTWAMDVFSAGCVIAELFLEGPIFSLSQLYKYRKGEYDPEHAHISKIEDKDIRELVSHMIQVQPESRYSAEEYLNFWRRKAFPEYFYSFLHQYMGLITDPSSGRKPVTSETSNFGEADDRIDRVYYDFDKISYFLGYGSERASTDGELSRSEYGLDLIPIHLDIPNNQHRVSSTSKRLADDGTLVFLTLVVSSLRNTARATARIRACDVLLAFAERVTDEAKLDRILPYVMTLLNDRADIVRVAAIRTVTQLMALVSVVSPVNAYIFPEYILPRLQSFIKGSGARSSPVVRSAYAACLGSLADTSSRFLDMIAALRADGSLPTADSEAEDGIATNSAFQTLFDVARNDLVEHFEAHTKALLTDGNASVRRAFLGSVSSLCIFFGSAKANDVVLSHLNTYLNDKDWMLKCDFFDTIVAIATFVGGISLEEFILPLMVQALTDPEEFVVQKALRSFASMAQLGLFQRSKTWELIDVVGRFTVHPNAWIREAAAHFIASATTYLPPADTQCIIAPLVRPFLKTSITDFGELSLLDALKKPLSRPVFEMAVLWTSKVDKGIFWKPARQQHTFSFGPGSEAIPIISAKDLRKNAFSRIEKNEEDEQWLDRLRNLGLSFDDDLKLLALREYIWRMAPRKPKEGEGNNTAHLNSIITLKQLNVTPQTVFFDENPQFLDPPSPKDNRPSSPDKTPNTITDALLDASTSIDDSLARRKKSYVNNRKAKNTIGSPSLPVPADPFSPRRDWAQAPSSLSSSPRAPAEGQDSSTGVSDVDLKPASPSLPSHSQNGAVKTDKPASLTDGSLNEARPNTQGHSIRHKPSAITLMSKNGTAKAFAETSTSSTTAFGKVDGPFLRESTHSIPVGITNTGTGGRSPPIRFKGAHTYDGRDPNVLKLLDSLYLENYPADVMDFGPMIAPVSRRQPIRKSTAQASEQPWRPEAVLVAMFGEHIGPINRVVVAPDHSFFITASDDGTVKIWDTARLERNVAHRSRQTHKHRTGAPVKSICFVENTHCFVSAATDGSVQVVKVNYVSGASATKYGKLQVLREYQLPKGEHVVWSEHYKGEIRSILLLATNLSRIVALDIRSMKLLYSLENPVHHGTPTCFCIDKKHNWLVVGTSHSVLDLWDLRFQVRLNAWGLPGAAPIHQLSVHPMKARNRWVCVAGGTGQGEVTVWDVEKMQCREVYRAGGTGKEGWRGYEPWKVDEEKPETMLSRFATALEPSSNGSADRGIRAFSVGVDTTEDGRESKYGFMVTGGSDRKVRFWDLNRIEASLIVSGLDAEEPKPSFTSSPLSAMLTLNLERSPQSTPMAPNAGAGIKVPPNTAAKRSTGRPSRSTMISLHQQNLLKSHLDSILDLAFLELPYGMTVSVDRSGVIYVFQ